MILIFFLNRALLACGGSSNAQALSIRVMKSDQGSCVTYFSSSMAPKGTTLGLGTLCHCTLCMLEARLHPKLAVWSARRCTFMQINTLELVSSHRMCLMRRGPGKLVDISLRNIRDDDHIIVQNNSITHNILIAIVVHSRCLVPISVYLFTTLMFIGCVYKL